MVTDFVLDLIKCSSLFFLFLLIFHYSQVLWFWYFFVFFLMKVSQNNFDWCVEVRWVNFV